MSRASDVVLLYATAPDLETAETIAAALVAEGCCACVNILGPMTSIYRWNGAIERTNEVAFLVKTTRAASVAACDAIISRHPFDVPAIVAFDVDGAASHPTFIDWVRANTTT